MSSRAKYFREKIEAQLVAIDLPANPSNLYDPMRYFLSLGGKRMRPVLTLLAEELFTEPSDSDIKVASAIELFHNFTLLHDDIMDVAPLRRGQQTVHEKWNENIGILSGDALMVKSYQQLAFSGADFMEVFERFNTTALEVCEGQQMDMDFEKKPDPATEDYLEMIRLKTAVLIGYSLWLGGKLGGASESDLQNLYQIGITVGLGFQIMDDFLDVFGDPESFGKTPGGDILAGKKTILWMLSMERGTPDHIKRLKSIYSLAQRDSKTVDEVMEIFSVLKIDQKIDELIREKFDSVGLMIKDLHGKEEAKEELRAYLQLLARRTI